MLRCSDDLTLIKSTNHVSRGETLYGFCRFFALYTCECSRIDVCPFVITLNIHYCVKSHCGAPKKNKIPGSLESSIYFG